MSLSQSATRSAAIARYTEIAGRLPRASFPQHSRHVAHLGELVDDIDVFVLDGFGVLNVGTDPVPGAVERIRYLQQAGKQVIVLTNGATMPVTTTHAKYLKWGFEFDVQHVVSSRNALELELRSRDQSILWGVAATAQAQIESLSERTVLLEDDAAVYDAVDGFALLSATQWTDSRQQMLSDSLAANKREVLVGNPDLVAPQLSGMSREPGLFAHALEDAGVCKPDFFGKPFLNVFDIAKTRIHGDVPGERIAMVGDTLHTDILGGAAAGWRTVLITDFGLMKGADVEQTIASAGIRPDFIAAVT